VLIELRTDLPLTFLKMKGQMAILCCICRHNTDINPSIKGAAENFENYVGIGLCTAEQLNVN